MAAVKGISKLSGQAKASTYPQPEGVLGDCMLTYGKKMGEDSVFGMRNFESFFRVWIEIAKKKFDLFSYLYLSLKNSFFLIFWRV